MALLVRATRAVRPWAGHPILGGFACAGDAARQAASDPLLLATLATFPAGDQLTSTAALSAVAYHLQPVVARWARSGMADAELADAEADLVVEALACLRHQPCRPASVVAQKAWHVVHGRRRTTRARGRRITSLPAELALASTLNGWQACTAG